MFALRWEPWAEMNRLNREMDRVFGRDDNRAGRVFGVGSYPALNLWEDGESLYVEAELPGFGLDDVEIYVDGDQLTLKGERRPPEQDKGSWHRQECGYGKFNRMLELPADVNADGVAAEFANGVLKISLPKREEVKARRIEVNAN